MDGKNIIIGHKSAYSKPKDEPKPLQKPVEKRAPRPMVDIYVGEAFIERISLHTLVRFSTVASTALPRHTPTVVGKQAASQGAPAATQNVNTVAEGFSGLKLESKSWADDASTTASDKNESSVADVSSPGASNTPPTSVAASTKTDTPRKSLAQGDVENASSIVKKLTLSMDVYYLPTNEAMKYAIKWMKDNARIGSEGKLMLFGPDSPQDADWNKLLDHYAAAVLLDLRPFPKAIRQELMDRITNSYPLGLYTTFTDVITYLPVEDPVVTRAVNQFYHSRRNGQYTPAQLDGFKQYLQADEFFQPYVDKINENYKWHEEVTASRRRERADQARQDYWRSTKAVTKAENVDVSAKKVDGKVDGEAEKDEDKATDKERAQPQGRRRNRRAQQAKGNGKGKDGAHVPGAEY